MKYHYSYLNQVSRETHDGNELFWELDIDYLELLLTIDKISKIYDCPALPILFTVIYG